MIVNVVFDNVICEWMVRQAVTIREFEYTEKRMKWGHETNNDEKLFAHLLRFFNREEYDCRIKTPASTRYPENMKVTKSSK